LIDCGEGTQLQLRRNKLKFGRINHIFISHLHGDHIYGLFGLISSFNLLDRTEDLHIYAHEPLRKGIRYIIRNYEGKLNYAIRFHPLDTGQKVKIYEDLRVEVYSFPLRHKIDSSGFLFMEKPRELNIRKGFVQKYNIPVRKIHDIKSGADFITPQGQTIPNKEITEPPYRQRAYAFCSDTAYTEDILAHIKGVDLLYHEATFGDEHKDQARLTLHSTAREAGKTARKAGAGELIIGHFSARYREEQIPKLVEEAREEFENTLPAYDGMNHVIHPYRVSEQ
jgi:ribonuclease Z